MPTNDRGHDKRKVVGEKVNAPCLSVQSRAECNRRWGSAIGTKRLNGTVMAVTRPPGRHSVISVSFNLENGSMKTANVSISSLKAGWVGNVEALSRQVPPLPTNEAPTLPGAAGTEPQNPPTVATVVAPPDGQVGGGEVPEPTQTMAIRQEGDAAGSTPAAGGSTPDPVATCHETRHAKKTL